MSFPPDLRRLAFLHTAQVHVATFEALVRAADPAVEVRHVVAEDLLADARRLGADDAGVVRRVHEAMAGAAAAGAQLVVCTCSTVGGSAERTPTGGAFAVARIDRAMADRAVALGPRVLVAVALESTLVPTRQLLEESAAALGRPLALQPLLVPDAWQRFEAGEQAGYLQAVAEAVRAAATEGARSGQRLDAVVLAQASMAQAVPLLQDLGIEVLASPVLGVRAALALLGAQGA